MTMNMKQLISTTLTMFMIVSLFSVNVIHAATVEATATNSSTTMRTELAFLEGTPGDNHLVYTYLENGKQYKVVTLSDSSGYIYDEETPENAVYSMKQKDEENAYKVSYLTLNGIDGSVISRYNGY